MWLVVKAITMIDLHNIKGDIIIKRLGNNWSIQNLYVGDPSKFRYSSGTDLEKVIRNFTNTKKCSKYTQ